ncbi:hypothetical protein GH714_040677 [Hevea brasiliensis]|uniref:DUF1421 domain-containing protein n=1 Tax=Hevea brasiliensis TaxID=3981 RepID=A0A6A6MPU8_HEVBR|nr:hypothetical protein GH714_040677 [Hevea brasiliensis]
MQFANFLQVHGGIKDLRDKQEIAETQLRLAKLRMSKDDSQLEKQNNTIHSSLGTEALSSVSQQSNQQLPVPVACPQQVPSLYSNIKNLPLQNQPLTKPAAAAQQFPTPAASHLPTISATAPLPSQFVPSVPQQETYYPPLPVSTPGTSHQKYVIPTQQSHPPYSHRPYQPPRHLPLNSHLSQLPQVQSSFTVVNPQFRSHHPEEVPFVPSQAIHRSSQPHDRPLSPQLFNIGSTDQPTNLHHSECTSANPPPQGYTNIVDFNRYNTPTHNCSSTMKSIQPSPSPSVSTGEIGFSHLPTARILPHAIPTASSVDSGSSSGEGGNRMPVDDVVDKVVAMGFRRDLVRATVRKLTENGNQWT